MNSAYLREASQLRHEFDYVGLKTNATRRNLYKALEPQILNLIAERECTLKELWIALPHVGQQVIKGSRDTLLQKGWIEQYDGRHDRNACAKHRLTELGKDQLRSES